MNSLKNKLLLLLMFWVGWVGVFQTKAQEFTSSITGTVIDKQSGFTIPGANVILLGTTPPKGVSTDIDGKFKLENVEVGRQAIQVSFLGYEPAVFTNLLVATGKELNIQVELVESIKNLNEVVISAESDKMQSINTMATVSARQFTVEEAGRYSGALQDPARMATNFAGVSGANDSRNDIIIRGNSPSGVLWRLEGIDIPSPNHFSTVGTTGGPVSMLNLNNLSNSDFMTSAWSADYGNATSGVFDLRLREGSTNSYQFLGQVGFNGFEFGVEGPFSKKKRGSFLLNYRYSTLGVFSALGINLGTGAAIPQYQDLTFKISQPTKKMGKFTLFGIGGTSFIEFKAIDSDSLDLFSDNFSNSRFSSTTGVIGASHSYFFDSKTLSKLVVSASYTGSFGEVDSVSNDYTEEFPNFGQSTKQTKYSANYKLNRKFNARNTGSVGVIYDHIIADLKDSVKSRGVFFYRNNFRGSIDLIQAYAQWQHRFNALWTLNLGVHNQTMIQNGANAIEPRIGVKYQPFEKHTFNLGTALHSQLQPLPMYFMEERGKPGIRPNEDLDFTRSAHFVLGHEVLLTENIRLKSEVYYQHLYNVPIDPTPSSWSMLNQGADFSFENRTGLLNEGTGKNYGLEITLERFFNRGYYFLVTNSIFESKYTASDAIERNTAYNTNYVLNTLGGKEFKLKKGMSLAFDTKVTLAGGRPYTPIDLVASKNAAEEIRREDVAFSERFDPYFRWDFKITFRNNGKRISQQFSVDLQNVTANKNVFAFGFNPRTGTIGTTYQRGFFPDVQYKIYF